MTTEKGIACSTPVAGSSRTSTFIKNWRYYHNAVTFQVYITVNPHFSSTQSDPALHEVEDQLFRESARYFTVHSIFFRELLITSSDDPNPAGHNDDNPLKLDGVHAKEFELLLSIIYPIDPFQEIDITRDEWKILMKLSMMWGMANLHALCIKKLSSLPASMSLMQKILFSRNYMVGNWLTEAYDELSRRTETISNEEVQMLGTQVAIRILRIREKWLVANPCRGCHSCQTKRPLFNLQHVVQNAFRDELEELMQKGIMIYGEDFIWLLDDIGPETSSGDGGNSTSEQPTESDQPVLPALTEPLHFINNFNDTPSVSRGALKKKKKLKTYSVGSLRR